MTLYTNIFDSDKKAFFLGYLTFEDGIITSVSDTFTGEYEDYSSSYAVPGFVDIHTHGGAGVDLSSPVGIDFDALGRYYLSKGVTTYLPSTTSCPHNDLMDTIAAVKAAMAKKSAVPRSRIAGIHIEGPYINPKRAGAHALDRIRTPKDWEIDEIIGASDGMTLYMTIAPELDNALNTIRRMTSAGARISIGHTDASAEQVYEGILAGAVNFTHTFNAMPALHHRFAGPVGVALSYGGFAEMICDGIHICPEVVKTAYWAKGSDLFVVVSDSMQAAGMSDGEYILGGVTVRVSKGQALIGSTLAGSVTNLHDELLNLMKFADITLEQAIPCVSANPAKVVGIYDRVGSLEAGKYADCVLLNKDYSIQKVIV